MSIMKYYMLIGLFLIRGLNAIQDSCELAFPGKGIDGKTVVLHIVTGPKNSEYTDITLLKDVDAIVNAANERCLGGAGVDGAVHTAAGKNLADYIAKNFLEITKDVRCFTGAAKATPAFGLTKNNIQCIVHAVGPRYSDDNKENLLRSVYTNSLASAREYAQKNNVVLKSIAFPSISTGIFGYPVNEASKIAIDTIAQEIECGNFAFDEVRFVVWPDNYKAYLAALVDSKQKKHNLDN